MLISGDDGRQARPLLGRVFSGLALAGLFLAAACPAQAAQSVKIGVVAPASGPLDVLGRQVLTGARIAAQGRAELVVVEESCEDGSGAAIAEKLAAEKVVAAIGFLCTATLDSALPRLGQAGIPAITVSVRARILMEDALKKGWPLFRLAPAANAERDRIADIIKNRWAGKVIALVDDGTINQRELSDGVRQLLEEQGIKPAFMDSFRPAQDVQAALIRRMGKAGVTHAFVAGDRNDIAILARDAARFGFPMAIMGGDTLEGADYDVPLAEGVLGVLRPGQTAAAKAGPVIEALKDQDIRAEGYVLPAHAAIDIVLDAATISAQSGAPLSGVLVDTPFDTAIGPVRFSTAHELATNPFVLMRWTGARFEPVAPMTVGQ